MKLTKTWALILSLLGLGLSSQVFAQTFKIDKEASQVYWKGSKVGGSHDGNLRFSSGELVWQDGELKSGELVVDMNSMTNLDIDDKKNRGKLLNHLKSDDFFAVSEHPTSKITFSKVQKVSGNKYKVTGDFTIRGNTNPVTFEATVKPEGDELRGTAELTFDRSKYNVKYNSGSFFENLGDKLIHDEIELKIDVVAKR